MNNALIASILRAQYDMTAEERLEFWETIQDEYCKKCGKEVQFDMRCKCTRLYNVESDV